MNAWPSVRLGDVLRAADRSVPVNDLAEVNVAGVYSFGRGLFKRGPLTPAKTSYRYFNRLVADDFVISQPKAWEGALARVPADFEGWYLSPVFPAFRAVASRLLSGWLEWYCKRSDVWFELQQLAKGLGARRETVSPEQFLSLNIPLPPLPEQQRLVARIDAITTNVIAAKGLQDQVIAEADQLCRALLHGDPDATATPLRDLVSLRPPDVSVQADETYHFAGVYCFGRGVFVGERKTGLDFAYPKLTRLRPGDFVYPKLMAWEGAFGIVPPECGGLVVSTEFPVFELRADKVMPEVLDTYFRDPLLWPQIAGTSIGTNVRRRRLNPQQFLDHRIPLPSMATQLRLKNVRAEVDALKAAQAASRAELDALLPAVLDRAFAGAL